MLKVLRECINGYTIYEMFPMTVRRLTRLSKLGDKILRTHKLLSQNKSHHHREQAERIEEFDEIMKLTIRDWRREDLNKY